MEAKLVAGLIQLLTTTIVAVGVNILFLYTMKNIKDQALISESAQMQKADDTDCSLLNIKQDMDVSN
jgi:hypothetical protein